MPDVQVERIGEGRGEETGMAGILQAAVDEIQWRPVELHGRSTFGEKPDGEARSLIVV